MNRIKHFMILALALTLSLGAWAQSQLLTTINASSGFTNGTQTFDNIVTVTLDNVYYNAIDGWYCGGSPRPVEVAPVNGVTVTGYMLYFSDTDPMEFEGSSFTVALVGDMVLADDISTQLGSVGITKIEVYGYAAAPDPYVPALDETTGNWNFLMPGSNKVVKAVLYDSIVLGPHVTLYDATPAFADGDIYSRGDSTIYYYDTNNNHSFYLRADEQADGKYFGYWADLDPTSPYYNYHTNRYVGPGTYTCGQRITAAYLTPRTLSLNPSDGGTLSLDGYTPATPTTVTFAANNNTVTVENITLPHTFWCDYINGNGELDDIINQLYGMSGGYCVWSNTPTANGNSNVTAGNNDNNHYITISAPYEGTDTVTGRYSDASANRFDYTLTISVSGGTPATYPAGVIAANATLDTLQVKSGAELTLVATPDSAHYLSAIGNEAVISNSAYNYSFTMPDEDTELAATFAAKPTLTLAQTDGGTLEAIVPEGEPVLLTTIIPTAEAISTGTWTNDTVTVTLAGLLTWDDGGWIVQYGDGNQGSVSFTAAAGFDIAYYKFYSSYNDSYIDSVAPYAAYPFGVHGSSIYSQPNGQGEYIGTGAVTRIEVYTTSTANVIASSTPNTYIIDYGTPVTVVATPDAQHYLVRFSDDDPATERNSNIAVEKTYDSVIADIPLSATFQAKPTLTLTANDGGTLEIVPAGGPVWGDGENNFAPTLPYTADGITLSTEGQAIIYGSGYSLAGTWHSHSSSHKFVFTNESGNFSRIEMTLSGNYPKEWGEGWTVDANTAVWEGDANRVEIVNCTTYVTQITFSGSGAVTVRPVANTTNQYYVDYGTEVTVVATPDATHYLVSLGEELVNSNDSIHRTFTMTAPVNLPADFRAKPVLTLAQNESWGSVTIEGAGSAGGAGGDVTIGDSTSTTTTTSIPTNAMFKYSYVQEIYTASEIGAAGTIQSLTMWLKNTASLARNIEIYMKEIEDSTFADATSWVSLSDGDLVATGTIANYVPNPTATTYTLDTPFEYSGNGNLLLCIRDVTGKWSGGMEGTVTEVDTNQTIYAIRDDSAFNISNPELGTAAAKGLLKAKNVVKFHIDAGSGAAAGITQLTENTYRVDYGTTLTVQATPEVHYHLEGWSCTPGTIVDNLDSTATLDNMIADQTVTATFAQNAPELAWAYAMTTDDTVLLANCTEISAYDGFAMDTIAKILFVSNDEFYDDYMDSIMVGTYLLRFGSSNESVVSFLDEYDPMSISVNGPGTATVYMVHDGSVMAYDSAYFTAVILAPDTLTLVHNEGGAMTVETLTDSIRVLVADTSYAVVPGAEVTVKAMPDSAHYMVNWDNDAAINYNFDTTKLYTVNGNHTALATFTAKPLLTLAQGRVLEDSEDWGSVTIEGAGSGSGSGPVDMTIGDSTSTTTNSYIPGYSLYEYSYIQEIYTASEIGAAGTIQSLTMWLKNTASLARNIEIYMKEIEDSTFADATSWVSLSDGDLVATGTIANYVPNPTATTYTLDTPFEYSGNGNLLLCIRDVTGKWSGGMEGTVTEVDTNQTIYAIRDDSAFNISNPELGTAAAKGLLKAKNVVKFHIDAGSGAAAGITQLTENTYRVDYGTTLTVQADATELHHVANWVDADSVAYPAADITYDNYFVTTPEPLFPAHSTLTLTVTADTMTKAIFGINSYDVTATAQLDEREEIGTGLPMGTVECRSYTIIDGTPSTLTPAASIELTAQGGTTTTLVAKPHYGYLFHNWTIGNEVYTNYIISVTEASDAVAHFIPDTFTVVTRHTPADYGTVEGGGKHAYLTNVTVEAVPNYGYHLDHWKGGSTEMSHTFQITEDTSFKAFFEINQYTITVEAEDSTMGSVSGTTTVDYLTEVEISAVANDHYSFVEWNDGDTNATRTITVTEDQTYTALFTPDVYTLTTVTNNPSMGTIAVVTPLPDGVTDNGNGNYSVVYGTELTVKATTTYRCFELVAISDGTEEHHNSTLSFMMDSDLALTATFANHLFTSDTTADVCDLFVWNGVTYTETPDVAPMRNYTTVDGCDSALVLNLTIRHSSTGDTAAATCNTFSWYEHINMTESQEVTHTFIGANAEGCDSIVTLHLSVGSLATADTTAVACDAFTWHGVTYTETPDMDPTYTYHTAEGCDSTITLHLTIGSDVQTDTTAVACDEFTWHDVTYTETPEVDPTYTIETAGGCSNTVTLHLTINHTTYAYENVVTCDSYTWHGTTYTESTAPFGGPTYTTEGSNGCDSITTLHLTVNTTGSTVQTVTACDSYTWINGVTYTQSTGILDAPTYTVVGEDCDVIVTLHLTINQSQSTTLNETVCDSYTWNGTTYTTSGTYTYTTEGANGCDSVVTLNLTVNQPTSSSETVTTCGAYLWNGTLYTESGVYTYTTVNAAGCDSTATLLLIIGQAIQTTVNQTACDSYEWNGTLYTVSGSYSHTYTTAAECDSIVTLNLTINSSVSNSFSATACDSYTWNGTTYAASGSYSQVLTTADGCDSTVTLTLTVNQPVSTAISATACDSYEWNGASYAASGTYTYTTEAANGCDSTVTLTLTINHSVSNAVSATACSSYEWNGTVYTTSGTYTYTTEAANGCDSVITLTLTVNQPVYSYIVVTADGSYEWNGTVYTTSGTYTYTTEAANGCDSIVTLTLTVNPVYTVTLMANNSTYGSVSAGGDVVENAFFTAVATANDGYEFVSWMNGNEVVSTSAVYTFQVTEDITLTAVFQPSVGIDDVDMDNVTIYSTDSRIFVRGAEGHEVYIYDINGRIIDRELNAPETVEFRLTATGVYLVKVGNAPAKRVVVVR